MLHIKNTDLMITQRFHGIVLALIYGIPFIAVSEDSKITGFLNEINHGYVFKEFERSRILGALKEIWENRNKNQEILLSRLPALGERAEKNTEAIKNVINYPG
jgi:polysaccharide pyruvyl transferase WcaK-like protein